MSNGDASADDPAHDEDLVTDKIYKATLFGDEYYGVAYSLPVQLRDNGVEDFGREHGLAWYSIWGTGLLHDEYGVVIETK